MVSVPNKNGKGPLIGSGIAPALGMTALAGLAAATGAGCGSEILGPPRLYQTV